MAPKKTRDITPSAAATAQASATAPASTPPQPKASSSSQGQNAIVTWFQTIQQYYVKETPQRTKLIDVFLAFLVAVGAVQFLYCVLAGNYPFNAFLSGFCVTVGQFVLTMSLRVQSTPAKNTDETSTSVSPERAFADYVVCSLILHFFCINFIN